MNAEELLAIVEMLGDNGQNFEYYRMQAMAIIALNLQRIADTLEESYKLPDSYSRISSDLDTFNPIDH